MSVPKPLRNESKLEAQVATENMIIHTLRITSNPNVFNPEMFNFRRLTIAPLLIVAGVVVIIVGIMKTPRNTEE